MNKQPKYPIFTILFCSIAVLFFANACVDKKKEKTKFEDFSYKQFKDSILVKDTSKAETKVNVLDNEEFIPGVDSLDTLLVQMDTMWHRQLTIMERLDTMKKMLNKKPGFSPEELLAIKENIRSVDSFLKAKDTTTVLTCKGKDCILYAAIDKSKQRLYLYLMGELKDSFKISSGKGKYETPNMDLRPGGPICTKYTSKKFPGGNYQGLGNMPYAVFLQGGYAIHGTTVGNFPKLGTKASHGCIRLHSDDAKIFNAMVKTVGLQQTWVTIKDSLPN